jgi:hypothetical protein
MFILCEFYVDLCKKHNKKKLFTDGRTDRQTTQNYSSEPHKNFLSKKKQTIYSYALACFTK